MRFQIECARRKQNAIVIINNVNNKVEKKKYSPEHQAKCFDTKYFAEDTEIAKSKYALNESISDRGNIIDLE